MRQWDVNIKLTAGEWNCGRLVFSAGLSLIETAFDVRSRAYLLLRPQRGAHLQYSKAKEHHSSRRIITALENLLLSR